MVTSLDKTGQVSPSPAPKTNDQNWTVFNKFKLSILALLFGTGSWIALTGLWLEMPLLLQQLPEGWSLASHLNMMIQLANIGPLLYWLLSNQYKLVNDISATHIQMWIGLFSCLMLVGFWNQTFIVFGQERSLMLLIFTFGLALVDCTSSVTFLPFIARFDSSYMTPYLVGEGLSGFIPSMVALVQGVGEKQDDCQQANITELFNSTAVFDEEILIEPRFSVETFFSSLLITLIISYLAFLGLNYLPIAKQEQRRIRRLRRCNLDHNGNRDRALSFLGSMSSSIDGLQNDTNSMERNRRIANQISRKTYFYLLGLIFWNCFTTFGFMPPLQPFSSLPYSVDTLHYVVILASLSYPAGCFYAMLVEHRSIRLITLLSIVATILAMYITFCAWLSPMPPFVGGQWHHSIGSWSMVICWVLFVTIASYAKTIITLIICDYNSKKGMFWVGMHTQFGGAIGAFLVFSLINYTKLFDQCPPQDSSLISV